MSLILGIETATKVCSVAISENGKLLALKEEGGAYSHSEKLTVFIEEVLTQSNNKLTDLDAIAVSKGPGSYTGLRIGVSAAKGLCYALDIPLIAVDTLRAMALGVQNKVEADMFCPMIDARRMEVYTALFDQNNVIQKEITAKIIDENSFADELVNNKIVFFGDGADKCKSILNQSTNTIFYNEGYPSAEYINQIAQEKFNKQEFEDVAYFEPYYLKDFIATTPKKLL